MPAQPPAPTLSEILTTTTLTPGPRLTWYSPGERIELTGHVLGMWLAKTAALVTAEAGGAAGAGARVHLGLPAHWRTVTWAAGCWLAGACVVLGAPGSDGTPPGLSVACQEEGLDDGAEVQVLVPLPSLALRWPGELPPLVLDGAADLMTYPDAFDPVPVGGVAAALETVGEADRSAVASVAGGPVRGATLSRTGLVAGLADLSGQTAPVLVRTSDVRELLLTTLAAWRACRAVVLVAPEADDALAATAARQEGAVAR